MQLPVFQAREAASSMNSMHRLQGSLRAKILRQKCSLYSIGGDAGGASGDGFAVVTGGTAACAPGAIAGVFGSGIN